MILFVINTLIIVIITNITIIRIAVISPIQMIIIHKRYRESLIMFLMTEIEQGCAGCGSGS